MSVMQERSNKSSRTGMYYITFPSETVVFNRQSERMVAVPTEKEAEEFIAEQEETHGD